jgi:hypothetical protein
MVSRLLEICQNELHCWSESEWFKKWVLKILEPRDDENLLMAEYIMTIGAV